MSSSDCSQAPGGPRKWRLGHQGPSAGGALLGSLIGAGSFSCLEWSATGFLAQAELYVFLLISVCGISSLWSP